MYFYYKITVSPVLQVDCWLQVLELDLTNATHKSHSPLQCFQGTMNIVLQGIPHVFCYIVDILVIGEWNPTFGSWQTPTMGYFPCCVTTMTSNQGSRQC